MLLLIISVSDWFWHSAVATLIPLTTAERSSEVMPFRRERFMHDKGKLLSSEVMPFRRERFKHDKGKLLSSEVMPFRHQA